jgi:hypothetical protein
MRQQLRAPALRDAIHDLLGPLRQQQPVEMRRRLDELPEPRPMRVEVVARLEDVGHAGAKDAVSLTGLLGGAVPLEGLLPVLVTEEAPRAAVAAPHRVPGPLGESLGVAVLARG